MSRTEAYGVFNIDFSRLNKPISDFNFNYSNDIPETFVNLIKVKAEEKNLFVFSDRSAILDYNEVLYLHDLMKFLEKNKCDVNASGEIKLMFVSSDGGEYKYDFNLSDNKLIWNEECVCGYGNDGFFEQHFVSDKDILDEISDNLIGENLPDLEDFDIVSENGRLMLDLNELDESLKGFVLIGPDGEILGIEDFMYDYAAFEEPELVEELITELLGFDD